MGYNTDFEGFFKIDPALSKEEIEYFKWFNQTRRVGLFNDEYGILPRKISKTALKNGIYLIESEIENVIDYNIPAMGQPSLWCGWTVSDDGSSFIWDGKEKFYEYTQWLSFMKSAFFDSNAWAKKLYPEVLNFLDSHSLNGEIMAFGEEWDDIAKFVAKDNEIYIIEGKPGRSFPVRQSNKINKKYEKLLIESRQNNDDLDKTYLITKAWCDEITKMDRMVKWSKRSELLDKMVLPNNLIDKIKSIDEKVILEQSVEKSNICKKNKL